MCALVRSTALNIQADVSADKCAPRTGQTEPTKHFVLSKLRRELQKLPATALTAALIRQPLGRSCLSFRLDNLKTKELPTPLHHLIAGVLVHEQSSFLSLHETELKQFCSRKR